MRAYRRPSRVSSMRAVPRRRTTLKRQAFGNFASAMQQRDSTNIVISKQEDVNIYTSATTAASYAFSFGTIMFFIPFFLASITIGRTPFTRLIPPSSASSPTKK